MCVVAIEHCTNEILGVGDAHCCLLASAQVQAFILLENGSIFDDGGHFLEELAKLGYLQIFMGFVLMRPEDVGDVFTHDYFCCLAVRKQFVFGQIVLPVDILSLLF